MGTAATIITRINDAKSTHDDSFTLINSKNLHRDTFILQGGLIAGALGTLIGDALGGDWGALILGGYLGGLGNDAAASLYDALNGSYNSFSDAEKQALRERGFIPYNPNDPKNYSPDLTYDRDRPLPLETDLDHDGIPNDIDPNPLTPNSNLNDGHPFDPESFDPPRRDPLVLDMNKDGQISTASLADSTAFFDITGDGIKEKVGWVQASEGIVVFDKNGNGKIDGIGEVFGTATTSGFYELRQLADSNYDNVIDRRDELYNQLKVWQDINQDGTSQANELKTLAQAGVKNIELNVIATNINLNGNLLTEAGRYYKLNSIQRKVA